MIELESLSLQKGHKVLLNEVNLRVHAGWRVGLVGENGSGKTTLFSLLKNPALADSGYCRIPRDWVVSHLEQEVADTERSALDYVIDGHFVFRELEKKIQQAEQNNEHNRLAHLHDEYASINGYVVNSDAASLLSGLGFSQADQSKAMSSFSGGWRIRLNLAKALMCPSDLLLLDEPTNHLDLDSILWLEKWLKTYQGTLVIVSHDREFLDQCVQQIVEIENQKLTSYKGNYSQYEVEKANAQVLQQAQFEKQQKQIAHMEDFVRRFKAKASKAKQAQSRMKALERMERILPAHSKSLFTFEFFNAEGLPNCLMRLDQADLGYGQQKIILNVNIELTPESRVGILGLNGSGKSTLLKSLVGDLTLLEGERFVNEKTRIGYFSQHQLEALDLTTSPLVHVNRLAKSLGENVTEQKARTFLGSFGFIGDRVFENIAHFSGGEKSRLALALICWTKPNILILDEPTNHLDMEMRHALSMALQKFNGALIVVSHDRHLIRCTTDELYLVHQGRCTVYEGDIDNYSLTLDKPDVEIEELPDTAKNDHVRPGAGEKKELKRIAAENRAKLSPLRKEVEKLDKLIVKLSEEKAALEGMLANPEMYTDSQKAELKTALARQQEIHRALEGNEERWLVLSDQIEFLSKASD